MAAAHRVLELLGPSTGGIRRHVAVLTGHLADRGWHVAVAGPAGVMEGAGRLDHEVAVVRGPDPRAFLRARRQLAEAVARHRPSVLHAHGLTAAWVAVSLPRRPPVVLSVHNLVLREARGRAFPVMRRLEALLPARVDAVIAISDEVARRFSGLPGADRIVVVPPVGPVPEPRRDPAEVRAELGVGPGEHLLVTAARLHPQKGLDVLVDAVAELRERRPGIRAVVLGEGRWRAGIEEHVARRGVADVVHLVGQRASIADELAAADVVVVPSRWESGPLVVFEALALGRPVVSTAVGAVPGLITDGVTGRIVPVGDAAALAAAVDDVLADPAGAAAMARAAGALARERFGAETLVDGVEAVYRRVIDGEVR